MKKVIEIHEKWQDINKKLYDACYEYIKNSLKRMEDEEADISEYNICTTYDGGNHSEYDANPYSHIQRVYIGENDNLYLDTEDCYEYNARNICASDLHDVAVCVSDIMDDMVRNLKKELIEYVRLHVEQDEIARAWDEIDKYRCPLSHADSRLHGKIESIIDDFCFDYDIDKHGDDWQDYDADNVFEQL